jgi:hypothetical protein
MALSTSGGKVLLCFSSFCTRCCADVQRIFYGVLYKQRRKFAEPLQRLVGKDGSYGFFSGRDASRAYITGKFQEDLNDNVEDFTDENMAALVHWKGFYLKVTLIVRHACSFTASLPFSLGVTS